MAGITNPSHAKKHFINSTNDHKPTPGDHDEDAVVVMDANGLPVKDSGIPLSSLLNGMRPQGPWDASGGTYPLAPELGYFWWIDGDGTLDGVDYYYGDWLVYVNDTGLPLNDWKKIDNTEDGKIKVSLSDLTPGFLEDKFAVQGRLFKQTITVGLTQSFIIGTSLILLGQNNYTNGGLDITYATLFDSTEPPNINLSIEDNGAVSDLRGFNATFQHIQDINGNYIGLSIVVYKTYLSGTEIIIEESDTDDCKIHWRAEKETLP